MVGNMYIEFHIMDKFQVSCILYFYSNMSLGVKFLYDDYNLVKFQFITIKNDDNDLLYSCISTKQNISLLV